MNQFRKIAVITGAGSGIGRAVALRLSGAGYAVALAGRREVALQETADLAHRQGVPRQAALVVPTDVSSPDSVDALFTQVNDRFGRLDLLFNNAGANIAPVPLAELTLTQWRSVMDVNVTGAFLCAQGAWRLMCSQTPRGGRIINNGSVSAQVPRPFSTAYTASKHAVTGLTKALSLEGRGLGIACGQIDIGNAATEMTERMSQGVPQANGATAAEPTIDVAHIAETVVHMAGLPLDANIPLVTVMATTMPFVGRG